jgi:putative membrane protein
MLRSVLPHPGGPLEPHDLWTAWNLDLWVLIPFALTTLIFVWGTGNVWRRAGPGRGISVRHCISFLGGMLALMIALVSPLDAMSAVLFSAHMTQHMLLVLVCAPLLVMSNFPVAWLAVLPRRNARSVGQGWNRSRALSRVWQLLSAPISAWSIFAIMLWVWHASSLYEAALLDETIHALEHFLFLGTAMLFWWILLKQTTQKHVQYGIAIPYLFLTILHSGVLGALMTFASQPWYPYYAPFVRTWGLTPLQDQQLAGLIMWIPGGAVLTLLTIGYFAAWLRALEKRSAQIPQREFVQTHPDPN